MENHTSTEKQLVADGYAPGELAGDNIDEPHNLTYSRFHPT